MTNTDMNTNDKINLNITQLVKNDKIYLVKMNLNGQKKKNDI